MAANINFENIDGPENSDILIFGRLCSTSTSPSSSPSSPILKLFAARIAPNLPPPVLASRPRPPRPDDPTPRKPPLLLLSTKRHAALEDVVRGAKKRAKVSSDSIAELSKKLRINPSLQSRAGAPSFKVPLLPSSALKGKGKARATPADETDSDVFGTKVSSQAFGSDKTVGDESELEKENKNVYPFLFFTGTYTVI